MTCRETLFMEKKKNVGVRKMDGLRIMDALDLIDAIIVIYLLV